MFFVVVVFFQSLLLVSLGLFGGQFFVAAQQLPQSEVDALNQIVKTMGAATNWSFDGSACGFKVTPVSDPESEPTSDIACNTVNNTPHITSIDLAYNYLNGSIPVEWSSMKLKFMDLEANKFSWTVPAQLGQLVNLETLRLSSNSLTGNLPMELSELKNLTDFRINDNNFNGSIPDIFQSWKILERLELQGSGLEGPIPSSIYGLKNLKQLKISDINGTNQAFPEIQNLTALIRIILRNCSISGEIPPYIWGIINLRNLDLSFNNLTGELSNVSIAGSLKFIFLSGNSLNGNIPESILRKGTNVDLSYNSFNWPSSEQPACREAPNLNLNLFRSSVVKNNLSGVLPCQNNFKCDRYRHSFHINCGGQNVKVNGRTFEGEKDIGGGAATSHLNHDANWGFSSTGDFADDDDEQNTHYIADSDSSLISELYTNARIAPLSLTYFGYCLENGNYLVTLHFAEILFGNDTTFRSLGKRIFDIYVQDKLVEKDFNIEVEASGVLKPIAKPYNVTVANNSLVIRFNWAGKGTTSTPKRGVYGPLVSAISVEDPNFKPGKKNIASIVVGVVAGFCVLVLVLGILYWKYYVRTKSGKQTDLKGLDLQTNSFTLKQIKAATNNFDSLNKIGEGGFGPVFKGLLSDATNVLLDRDLNPKISDFGLAKLDEEEKIHISTRVAGTIGYMAPEYVLWGYLTYKADVYSFGVVALEIFSGINNVSFVRDDDCARLLDWASHLQQIGKLMELVDPKLKSEFNEEEAERMIKVSLLCTNGSPSLRPTMSEVVGMLGGTINIPDAIPEVGFSQILRFKAIKDQRRLMQNQSLVGNQAIDPTLTGSSTSGQDLYEVNAEPYLSTGDFLNDDYVQITRYIADLDSSLISELYTNAKIVPLSLTYFGYCLANGNYLVTLHFAEIAFPNDTTFRRFGRQIFDIYVQDKLVEKDFNIEAEASGILKPISKPYNVIVANNILEIRFNWAGKGTTSTPKRGVYGPLVSAISVEDPSFKPGKKNIASIVVGVVAGFCFFVLVLDLKGLDLQTNSFTLKQIKAATNNFDSLNKIGEGGFGPVFKGLLSDGTIIAVKQLSSKSKQGNREFLNEIGMISCLQHPNLVKRHGCCTEGDQLLLVYEYMENNCLARALLACHLQQNGKLMELVDPKLKSEFKEEEAERMIKVSLLCTSGSPSLRPTMSEVVGMLEGTTNIPEVIPESGSYSQQLRFKAIRDQRRLMQNQSLVGNQAVDPTLAGSSTSGQDLFEVNAESYLRYKATTHERRRLWTD
ncbi:hypothetical protein LWI28_012102 [Acer negundo]|uniref:non-specific serine/threonine protein kinase n=1 Tax=Acer negundo TaxID=4023 RepID=A0AAD5JT16_ACENE|nr:hypothetical protein LWI28_012102 [Acer negundo]